MHARGSGAASGGRLGSPASRFRIIWAGQAVSQLGNYLAYAGIPLFVASLVAEGSFELGVTSALESAPTLLFGLFAGVLIDRFRVRRLLILSDLARAVAFGWLAVVASADPGAGNRPAVLAAMLVALAYGTFSTLFDGGLFASLPSLLPTSELSRANGRLAATQNVAFAVGPALAGVLISATGTYTLVFALDAVTFLVSAVSILLAGPLDTPRLGGLRVRTEIADGLRFVWREPRLRVSTLAVAGSNFAAGFIEATFVLVFADLIGATAEWQQGLLFGVLGSGAVAGAAIAPSLTRRFGLGRVLTAGMLLFGTGYFLFTVIPFGVLGAAVLFSSFSGLQLLNVPVITLRQTYAPPELLGRVMTATRSLGWATLPLGSLVLTAVADATGSFAGIARLAPLLIVGIGLSLFPTVIWRDTVGVPRIATEET